MVAEDLRVLREGKPEEPPKQAELLNTTIIDPEMANRVASLEKENHRQLMGLRQAQAEQPLLLNGPNPMFGGEEDRSMEPRRLGESVLGSPKPESYGVVSSNMRMRSQSPVSGLRSAAQSPRPYPQPSALQKQLCEARDEIKCLKARTAQLERQLEQAHSGHTEALEALTQSEREKGAQALELARANQHMEGYKNALRLTAAIYKQKVLREGRETNNLLEFKDLLLPGFAGVNKAEWLDITHEDERNSRLQEQQRISPAFL